MNTNEIEVWIAMDEEGNFCLAKSLEELPEMVADMAGDCGTVAVRVAKITVKMTPPKIEEHAVTVADEEVTA